MNRSERSEELRELPVCTKGNREFTFVGESSQG
jgi:hypothetical protein